MGFQQGLSGLNVASKALDTIGNNISNSGTVGFKAATTQFADVFASSLSGGGGGQIGIGAALARVTQQFSQGNITNTNNPLDMSINGAGFYRMDNNGTITYTRAGQFQLDKDGYVVGSGGLQLTGYSADPITGTISPGNLTPLRVVNTNIAPHVTSASDIQLNLDSRALPPSAMSHGSISGAAALAALTPITQGVNDVLDLVVDGNAISVTIPPNASGYTAGGLAATLQSVVNAALSGTGAAVTVTNNSSGALTITSDSVGTRGALGTGSTVTLSGLGGPAANLLLGAPVATAGTTGVTPPATAGFLTGGVNLPTPDTGAFGGTDLTFDLTVDGVTQTVTLADAASPYATNDGPPSTLQTQLQAAVNTAFGAGAPTVTAAAGAPLAITSTTTGLTSAVSIANILPAGVEAALFGSGATAPVATAGTAPGPVTTAGFLTGGLNLPTSVTIASGESFNLTVDGVTQNISVPAGTYSTTGAPSALQSTLQAAVTAQFPGVTVAAASGAPLRITSATTGAASSVSVGAMTSGIQSFVSATTVAGADNFNQITGQTSATLTSQAPLTAPDLTTNNTLNLTIDGQAVSVTLAAVNYDGTAGQTRADLAADIQSKLNNALAAVVPATTARVTATMNASNRLVITSNSLGSSSSVALTGTGGTSATTLFGANPAILAGNQSQTVNPLGFTASTAQTVYDSQGNPHNLTLYFAKTSQGNIWQMYSTLDNGQQTGPTTLQFNGTGALVTPMPITLPATGSFYQFTSSSTNASTPNPLQFSLSLTGTTQYGVNFGVNTLSQDGYSSGQLSGISVASDGVIQGRYSNGKSKNMGQIVLVSFNNPNGLQSLGGNQWTETLESGQNIPGAPGTGSLGLIQSAAVEESNTDLTKELVEMITQQRVYQANAQSIKTMDQVLQTLVNLR